MQVVCELYDEYYDWCPFAISCFIYLQGRSSFLMRGWVFERRAGEPLVLETLGLGRIIGVFE